MASVKHVTRYIQPGLELIALDPKRSATIIGAEAFTDDATLHEVARRAAIDIGVANQEGCANARVIYTLSGTDPAGLAKANTLGELIYSELVALPPFISTSPLYPNRDLFELLESSRMTDDFYRVFGGEQREGAIVVSQFDEPVDYGLEGVCDRCQACVRRCPVGAIPGRRREHRGVVKAKLNTKRCLPIVTQAAGCSVCMKVCPVQAYGLPAVLEEYERSGEILGTHTDALEGYDWTLDGRHYGPGETPRVPDEVVRPEGYAFDPDRADPPSGYPVLG